MFAPLSEPGYPILKARDFIDKLVVLFLRLLMLEDRLISINDALQVSDFGIDCPYHNVGYHAACLFL